MKCDTVVIRPQRKISVTWRKKKRRRKEEIISSILVFVSLDSYFCICRMSTCLHSNIINRNAMSHWINKSRTKVIKIGFCWKKFTPFSLWLDIWTVCWKYHSFLSFMKLNTILTKVKLNELFFSSSFLCFTSFHWQRRTDGKKVKRKKNYWQECNQAENIFRWRIMCRRCDRDIDKNKKRTKKKKKKRAMHLTLRSI